MKIGKIEKMAKERLSKLQKWILVEANKREFSMISQKEIYQGFWGEYNYKNSVILSRSLRNLKDKGLICGGYKGMHNSFLYITDKGKKIAAVLCAHGTLTIRKS